MEGFISGWSLPKHIKEATNRRRHKGDNHGCVDKGTGSAVANRTRTPRETGERSSSGVALILGSAI